MYMAYWIGLRLEHLEQALDSPAGAASPYQFTTNHLCWTFALLARVEDSPSADDVAQMRSLARGCISLIKLAASAEPINPSEEPQEASPNDLSDPQDYIAPCWMIVACITGIWAQHDLWEEARETVSFAPT